MCRAGPSEVRLSGIDVAGIPGRRRAGRTRAVDAADGPPGRYRVAYAASRDETRYTLMGVLLEVVDRRLKLVATDGHRLARFHWASCLRAASVTAAGSRFRPIVPVRLLNEGVRLGGKLGGSVLFELHDKAAPDPHQRVHSHMEPVGRRTVPRLTRAPVPSRVHGYGVGADRRPCAAPWRGWPPCQRAAALRAWCCRSRIPAWCCVLPRMPVTALRRSRRCRRSGPRERCRRPAGCGSPTCRTRSRVWRDLSTVELKFCDDKRPVPGGDPGPGVFRYRTVEGDHASYQL